MNATGTYVYIQGQGLVKVSDEIPRVTHRDCWMPKGDVAYYDKSARRKFESRAQKRAWLKKHGMREGGLITNPDKRWEGPTKNATKLSAEKKAQIRRANEWVNAQGGSENAIRNITSKMNKGES